MRLSEVTQWHTPSGLTQCWLDISQLSMKGWGGSQNLKRNKWGFIGYINRCQSVCPNEFLWVISQSQTIGAIRGSLLKHLGKVFLSFQFSTWGRFQNFPLFLSLSFSFVLFQSFSYIFHSLFPLMFLSCLVSMTSFSIQTAGISPLPLNPTSQT